MRDRDRGGPGGSGGGAGGERADPPGFLMVVEDRKLIPLIQTSNYQQNI